MKCSTFFTARTPTLATEDGLENRFVLRNSDHGRTCCRRVLTHSLAEAGVRGTEPKEANRLLKQTVVSDEVAIHIITIRARITILHQLLRYYLLIFWCYENYY